MKQIRWISADFLYKDPFYQLKSVTYTIFNIGTNNGLSYKIINHFEESSWILDYFKKAYLDEVK